MLPGHACPSPRALPMTMISRAQSLRHRTCPSRDLQEAPSRPCPCPYLPFIPTNSVDASQPLNTRVTHTREELGVHRALRCWGAGAPPCGASCPGEGHVEIDLSEFGLGRGREKRTIRESTFKRGSQSRLERDECPREGTESCALGCYRETRPP